MRFGEWLYSKRRELRLTQGELARRAGISTSYVSTLERGQPHALTNASPQPAPDVVEAIAKVLGEDIDAVRVLAGYAPNNDNSTFIDITKDITMVLKQSDVSEDDLEEYERAVSTAVAIAEQRIAEKRKQQT